jgi:hypothetical protein
MEDIRQELRCAIVAYHDACFDAINREWDANQAVQKAVVQAVQTNGDLTEVDSALLEYKRILLEDTRRELALKADAERLLALLPENERHLYHLGLMPPE